MHIDQRKEQFSRAYVLSIAATLGINTSTPSVDDDSVDLELSGKGYKAKVRNPKIELQLKCTENIPNDDGFLHFPLSIKNYNDLRGDDLICPRYLFVITVPQKVEEWIESEQSHMKLKHTGYWYSLKDAPESENGTSVTLRIPVQNMLSTDALQTLMAKASEGQAV